MTAEISHDIKVALSYIEDAKRKLTQIRQEYTGGLLARAAENILNSELVSADEYLQKATDSDETITSVRCKLVQAQALILIQVAFELDKQTELYEVNDEYIHWMCKAAEKHKELVRLQGDQHNYFNFGVSLFCCHRDAEALEAFQIAERGEDEQIAIKATKMIAEIKTRLEEERRRTEG